MVKFDMICADFEKEFFVFLAFWHVRGKSIKKFKCQLFPWVGHNFAMSEDLVQQTINCRCPYLVWSIRPVLGHDNE